MLAYCPLLTILIFLPLAGSLLLLPLWGREAAARSVAFVVAAGGLALTGWLYGSWRGLSRVPAKLPGYLLLEDAPWIPSFGIRYTLGLDGISLLMVMLTSFTFCVALAVSWNAIKERAVLFLTLLLVMESGIMGVFLSLDLALFYLFWEIMLIPMFFLIGIWGHGRKIYSTIKFFLFTMFGSLLILLAAHALTPLVYTLALLGIFYASLVAFAQEDMKRLIAYSSIGHMGYVAIGIAAWSPVALSGSILQMANHGVTTGALFCLIGMLDERAHTREIAAFGGLWGKIPLWSFFFLIFSLTSMGVPGLNSFIGEFLILAGTIRQSPLVVVLSFVGIILPLIYMVRLVQEVVFQGERQPLALSDLSLREIAILGALLLLDLWVGVHPAPLLDMIHLPVQLLTGGAA